MNTKTTNYVLLFGIFLVCQNLISQNVTDIFPTRVTSNSVITIVGTGFSSGDENDIRIQGSDISTTNRNWVSSTEMNVEISITGSSRSGTLNFINGSTMAFDASVNRTIEYIQPSSRTLSNTRDYFVEEIYTNWDWDGSGFWRSNDFVSSPENNSTWPNNKHELLGFKMYNGSVFSTDVDNRLLLSGLGFDPDNPPSPLPFEESRYKAYSTNGVEGRTTNSHYILTGDLIDEGLEGSDENPTNNNLSTLSEISGITIFDAIVDGKNGLELGTGISNFNNDISVRFFSGNGDVGAIGDNEPDLLITQIAQAGGTDIYYYADERGNIVGRPIKLSIPENSSNPPIAEWRLDLFSFPGNQPFSTTNPNKRGFTSDRNQNRPMRLIAFKLEDFLIDAVGTPETNINHIENVNNINVTAGGTADLAFLAYNAGTFDIKSPLADPLLSKFVCRVDGTSNVIFNVNAGIDDGNGNLIAPNPGATPSQTLSYQWLKFNIPEIGETNDFYEINGVSLSDLATYKVKVSNANGTVILPVTLSEGGTPTFWNGSAWTSPFGTVNDEDRNLVFSSSYNPSSPPMTIEGCDCTVASGSNVTIASGTSMMLYDEITIQPEILADPVEGISAVPAGTFTLENNANLIQTKDIMAVDNINSGNIRMERNVDNLETSDYVYWSSPVFPFNVNALPGNNAFMWNVNQSNPSNGTVGNWASASGEVMDFGKGYIKRVPSAVSSLTTALTGVPRNGRFSTPIELTSGGSQPSTEKDWNLIGNPYPSSINAEKFLIENADSNLRIQGAVYLWTHANPISTTPNPSPFYNDEYVYNYGDQYLVYNLLGQHHM